MTGWRIEMDMNMALKLIIVKSKSSAREAMRTLQAIQAKSPVVQQRYNHCVEMALSDPQAAFTAEERAILADSLAGDEDGERTFVIRVRLTEVERSTLQTSVDEAGVSMSEYVRRKVFGENDCKMLE
jgi:hypothetical protein